MYTEGNIPLKYGGGKSYICADCGHRQSEHFAEAYECGHIYTSGDSAGTRCECSGFKLRKRRNLIDIAKGM